MKYLHILFCTYFVYKCKTAAIRPFLLSVTLVLTETNADLEKCETRKTLRQVIWTYVLTLQKQLYLNWKKKKRSLEKPPLSTSTNSHFSKVQSSQNSHLTGHTIRSPFIKYIFFPVICYITFSTLKTEQCIS